MTAMRRTSAALKAPAGSLQETLFRPDVDWRAPRVSDLPADWNAYARVSADVETRDDLLKKLGPGVRRGAYVVGLCLAFERGPGDVESHYLPIRHLGGDNMDEGPQGVFRYAADQARTFRGEVVGAKLDYDLDFLAEAGVEFRDAAAFKDVLVAEPLLDELQFTYGLDAVLKRHGLEPKDETGFREAISRFGLDEKSPKKDLWKLPGRYVDAYGRRDVVAPLELLRRQEAQIELQGLGGVWSLEQACTPVLVRMRRRGVPVDMGRLDEVEAWAKAQEQTAWDELERITGVRVRLGDAMKAEVIAQALDAVDVLPPRTDKGAPSITKGWLEALDHPAGAVIRQARKMSQLQTTFVASIRAHAVNGRIHCTFNQIVRQKEEFADREAAGQESATEGAAYGRLSCVDPNLQQQPSPDREPELGRRWRRIYVAEPGAEWCQPDYSQQEPRFALHLAVASGPHRIGRRAHEIAVAAANDWWADPSIDGHASFTKLVHGDRVVDRPDYKVVRGACKQVYLGVVYGMGGPELCRKIGLPTKVIAHFKTGRRIEVAGDEGQRLLDRVDERAPYLRATAKAVEAVAKARGYVTTISGRRCRFPIDEHGNYDWTHKAYNRAVQGNAADQTKTAMVALDREGFALQLQVHDEFDFPVTSRLEGRRAAEIMEQCVSLHVPSKVDVGFGPSWGEVKED